MRTTKVASLCLAAAALLLATARTGRANEVAWEALRAGAAVAVVRHALAPGTGDPPNFRLGNCRTQRNLSEAGRAQAAALGPLFAKMGVLVTDVRSSRWCRALDTATLAFPAVAVTPDANLDSFFGNSARGPAQTARLRALVEGWARRQGTLVLVTHQVNITALTEIVPAEGEIIVLRPQAGVGFVLVGTIKP